MPNGHLIYPQLRPSMVTSAMAEVAGFFQVVNSSWGVVGLAMLALGIFVVVGIIGAVRRNT